MLVLLISNTFINKSISSKAVFLKIFNNNSNKLTQFVCFLGSLYDINIAAMHSNALQLNILNIIAFQQ